MSNELTLAQVEKVLPANLKNAVTQKLVDQVNNIVNDPIVAEQIRNNFISYVGVLKDGKFKTEDYLNAVVYVSYKLMGNSNQDAYFKTFPQRHAALLAKGVNDKDIAAYVCAYNKGKLVNLILEQSLVPTWVLNQHIYQKAINTQADLMLNAKSEMVRSVAANSILTHLAKPKEVGPLINIDARESSGMNELKDLLRELAERQKDAIEKGSLTTKDIAEQKIIEGESIRVPN